MAVERLEQHQDGEPAICSDGKQFAFLDDNIRRIGLLPAHPTIFRDVFAHQLLKCFEHAPVVAET